MPINNQLEDQANINYIWDRLCQGSTHRVKIKQKPSKDSQKKHLKHYKYKLGIYNRLDFDAIKKTINK